MLLSIVAYSAGVFFKRAREEEMGRVKRSGPAGRVRDINK